MKRPCCREFGTVRFIISEDNATFEIRTEHRATKELFKATLGKFTTKDADLMVRWLQNASLWLMEARK